MALALALRVWETEVPKLGPGTKPPVNGSQGREADGLLHNKNGICGIIKCTINVNFCLNFVITHHTVSHANFGLHIFNFWTPHILIGLHA